MRRQISPYSPRPGSKVAMAISAMLNGPMTAQELGKVVQRASTAVNALLLRALAHSAIIKIKDKTGRLYFALPGTPLDERFVAVSTKETAAFQKVGNGNTFTDNQTSALPSQGKALILISSNTHALVGGFRDTENEHACNEMHHETDPSSSYSAPVIAGLFSDGELTIAVNGECLRLNTVQRQQLYTYLHKIRYLA